uniref:Uncharacterized protein n=1 Tax=Schistocephalus solidus TaxID=70667 RepID=A0A0X3PDY5_SCHSO
MRQRTHLLFSLALTTSFELSDWRLLIFSLFQENTFSYAFYAVCVADGLILAIIIMLISMLCCPTREKDESGNSHRGSTQPSTYPQPVFYGQFQPVGTMPPGGVYYNGQGAPQPVYDVMGNDFNNTFPSNSRFANWNSDSREPLYRYLYTFAWSTVFGSKK